MKETTTKTSPKIEHAIRTIPQMVTMRSVYANEGFRLGVQWALEQIRIMCEQPEKSHSEILDETLKLAD